MFIFEVCTFFLFLIFSWGAQCSPTRFERSCLLVMVARRGPKSMRAHRRTRVFGFLLRRFFCKIPSFLLKRRLRRAFWPRRPPKGRPKHLCHSGAQMVVVFRVFGNRTRSSFLFSGFRFGDYFSTSAHLPKGPLGCLLGCSFGVLGCFLGPLGCLLGASWSLLGRLWASWVALRWLLWC